MLSDGQTVLQHGFDAASRQTYLEASPVSVMDASDLNLVPEPSAACLALLATLLALDRVRFQAVKQRLMQSRPLHVRTTAVVLRPWQGQRGGFYSIGRDWC